MSGPCKKKRALAARQSIQAMAHSSAAAVAHGSMNNSKVDYDLINGNYTKEQSAMFNRAMAQSGGSGQNVDQGTGRAGGNFADAQVPAQRARADSLADNTPLGRMHAKSQAEALKAMMNQKAESQSAAKKPSLARRVSPRLWFYIAIIGVSFAFRPQIVQNIVHNIFSSLIILVLLGFCFLIFLGKAKVKKMLAGFKAEQKPVVAKEIEIPPVGSVDVGFNATQPSPRKSKKKSFEMPKRKAKPAYSDGPIQTAKSGLFGRKRKKDDFDPFARIATERNSY